MVYHSRKANYSFKVVYMHVLICNPKTLSISTPKQKFEENLSKNAQDRDRNDFLNINQGP